MSIENDIEQLTQDNSLKNVRPDLIERVSTHMGEEYVDMPVYIAAQYDTGDLENSDPRIRASNKSRGEWTAAGGKGPRKNNQ